MPLCSRRAWTTIRGLGGPLQVDHIPTPGCYDGIVPPGCDFYTLTNVIFRTVGWPNGRGDRVAYSSWRSTGPVPGDNQEHWVTDEVVEIVKPTVGVVGRPLVQLGLDLQY